MAKCRVCSVCHRRGLWGAGAGQLLAWRGAERHSSDCLGQGPHALVDDLRALQTALGNMQHTPHIQKGQDRQVGVCRGWAWAALAACQVAGSKLHAPPGKSTKRRAGWGAGRSMPEAAAMLLSAPGGGLQPLSTAVGHSSRRGSDRAGSRATGRRLLCSTCTRFVGNLWSCP